MDTAEGTPIGPAGVVERETQNLGRRSELTIYPKIETRCESHYTCEFHETGAGSIAAFDNGQACWRGSARTCGKLEYFGEHDVQRNIDRLVSSWETGGRIPP